MLVSDFAKPGESIEDVIIRYLRDHDAEPAYLYLEGRVLTEENTDMAISFIRERIKGWRIFRVPFILSGACAMIDRMMPEMLLGAIRDIMIRQGLLSERRISEANPFRPH